MRKLGIQVILYVSRWYADNGKLSRQSQRSLWVCNLSPNFSRICPECRWSPRQQIEFLGFTLDSNAMTISPPSQKLTVMLRTTKNLAEKTQTSLREISKILWTMVATHSAILTTPLYYRYLEGTKSYYLGCGFLSMTQSHSVRTSSQTWGGGFKRPTLTTVGPYKYQGFDHRIWCIQTRLGCQLQRDKHRGQWTATEQLKHINYLEMKAAFLALQSFCTGRSLVSVLILMDNVTVITFLNKMGGNHSHSLSDLAKEVWMWCIESMQSTYQGRRKSRQVGRADILQIPAIGNYTRFSQVWTRNWVPS